MKKLTLKDLKPFCGVEGGSHNKPWIYKGRTYATNRIILIRVDYPVVGASTPSPKLELASIKSDRWLKKASKLKFGPLPRWKRHRGSGLDRIDFATEYKGTMFNPWFLGKIKKLNGAKFSIIRLNLKNSSGGESDYQGAFRTKDAIGIVGATTTKGEIQTGLYYS